jgi:hypothetical protein
MNLRALIDKLDRPPLLRLLADIEAQQAAEREAIAETYRRYVPHRLA